MKLKLYKDYLQEEVDNFKTEKEHPDMHPTNDRFIFWFMIAMLVFSFFLPMFSYASLVLDKSYSCELNKVFPEIWECKGCGYENYDGIKKCSVCGKSRR